MYIYIYEFHIKCKGAQKCRHCLSKLKYKESMLTILVNEILHFRLVDFCVMCVMCVLACFLSQVNRKIIESIYTIMFCNE